MTGFDTRATRGPERSGPTQEEPLAFPVWQVADYAYDSAEHYSDVINERRQGQVYGRYGNPTTERTASLVASLEGAESGWVFSSGMAAIHAVLMHFAGSGDTLAAARTLYGGTYGLFTEGAERSGIRVNFFDATDPASLERLISGCSAVFVEMVANPTFEVADIESIAALCADASVPLVVDNTVPTPALCNPIEMGADVVVHSASKYLGGHHDLMAGVVVGNKQTAAALRKLAIRYGSTSSAFESWLLARGAATLGLRVERQCASAMAVAELLAGRDGVRVLYPGLATHPQHLLAAKVLRGFTGMVGADFQTTERAWAFMDACEVARVGSSFGGVHSELTHPASTSHRQFSIEDRAAAGITEGLVRISVGIEDVSDLTQDFENALGRL